MPTSPISRRSFLRQFNCAAVGSSAILNTLLNLKLANSAAADGIIGSGTDSKALVCVFLSGGADSFQMMAPWEQSRYDSYASTRGAALQGGIALERSSLLQMAGPASDFALHPALVGLHEMATGTGAFIGKKRLAAIANVGTLVQPITKSEYRAWYEGSNTALPIPRALFSHSDQVEHWQTGIPQGMSALSGWAGRAADLLDSAYNTSATSMSISLSGNNLLQVGKGNPQFVITPEGSLGIEQNGASQQIRNQALRTTLGQTYSNLLSQSFATATKQSDEAQLFFQQQFDSPVGSLGTAAALFPNRNKLASSLSAVLRSIKIRSALGLRRQTFFINSSGWDNHFDLLVSQANQLAEVDAALTAFQLGLEQLGLADDVVTFTASDFGRTLNSNGGGTDHGWGGNAFVMGGPVDGGKIFGTYPSFNRDGPDDVSGFLPSTSVDVYIAEMLRWFGVTGTNMATVLPNIGNFWNPLSGTAPLGFIKS